MSGRFKAREGHKTRQGAIDDAYRIARQEGLRPGIDTWVEVPERGTFHICVRTPGGVARVKTFREWNRQGMRDD